MKCFSLPYFCVGIQLSCLFIIAATGPLLANSDWGILVEFTGIFLAILAIYHMRIGNFNIAPVPKTEGELVTSGIYKYLRHPMYLAQLMAVIPLLYDHYTHFRLLVWCVLLINLLFKQHYEEKLLKNHFKGYSSYMKTSWRMIPFIY